MSITALYVFTPTAFTAERPTIIEQLVVDPPGGTSPRGSSIVARNLVGSVVLEPGVYRLHAGASLTPGPHAQAVAGAASVAANLSGYALAPIATTKSGWPDPPVVHASTVLNIPMSMLTPFLADTGMTTVLGPPPGQRANG